MGSEAESHVRAAQWGCVRVCVSVLGCVRVSAYEGDVAAGPGLRCVCNNNSNSVSVSQSVVSDSV